MAGSLDVDSFAACSDALQAAALATTRLAASLPADLAFHRSIDTVLAHDIDAFSDRVLSLASKLVRVANAKLSRVYEEEDVVDDFVHNVVDPMEEMLEGTDSALDVFLGKRRDPVLPIPPTSKNPSQNNTQKQPFRGRLDPALTHASHLPKPQLSFKHTVSNTDESPYIPSALMPHKWCAKVPLGYVLRDEGPNQGNGDVFEYDDEEKTKKCVLHPYYYELTHPSFPDHVFIPPEEPSLPPSLDSPSPLSTTSPSLKFISNPKSLLSMANALTSVTELAVDLEHHSYRSCRGFLALMQISTREGDFVVDLLVPEVREGLRQAKDKSDGGGGEARMANEAGQVIARVFADPSIIKVFHGAESDIVWLQQDFNIFVVGLFDTFHASKLLEFPKHSLAYLLETYCNFIPDKRYQLADWRIRPLPAEMLSYARSDTHFLLYVYDILRLSLIKRSTVAVISGENRRELILGVLVHSSRTALRLYETEVYDAETGAGPGGWDTLAKKWNKLALVGSPSQRRGVENGPQAVIYKAVHRWREEKAREEDESTRYVLPTHYLFLLAERAPTTTPDLLSLFNGSGGINGTVPPVLKRRLGELVAVIKDAVETTRPRFDQGVSADVIATGALMVLPNESETRDSSTPSSSSMNLTNESRLWVVASSTTSVTTSSLFGVSISRERKGEITLPSTAGGEESYSALGDVSFTLSKNTSKSTFTHAQVSNDSAKRFEDIMGKIHKSLVISSVVSIPLPGPSVRIQASETSHLGASMKVEMRENDPVVSDPILPAPEGQIEIPFVPAHERRVSSNPQSQLKDDTIVVVGRADARQRKRKRERARGGAPTSKSNLVTRLGGTEIPASNNDYDWEMEKFDYSGVPNLLDNESKPADARDLYEEDERKRKKRRHAKGSGLSEHGNLRAQPRDQREVRSGNKTHTFR